MDCALGCGSGAHSDQHIEEQHCRERHVSERDPPSSHWAPSKMRSSVVWKSTPPRSSAHPAMSEDWGASSTVQLAAKATSKKSSSTRK
eukprot:scaffold26059_cov54-Phaeocystis_antarctica.AAC.2